MRGVGNLGELELRGGSEKRKGPELRGEREERKGRGKPEGT